MYLTNGGRFVFANSPMELFELKDDVKVFCITVKTFPEGIGDAFQALENMHPSIYERPFYGICYMNDRGSIVYKAAVLEKYTGEGQQYGCETYTISKGCYLTETIFDYMNNISVIGKTFEKLFAGGCAGHAACIEWYRSPREVVCMVKADNSIKRTGITC